jgi:hypothetical protein
MIGEGTTPPGPSGRDHERGESNRSANGVWIGMANWHEVNETAKPEKRTRFIGIRKGGSAEPAPRSVSGSTTSSSSGSKDGLREERQRTVEAYYGVYPADAAARSRANIDLRNPPARLEATA